MKRVKIGDVLEIPTKKGLAYAIYTHHTKNMQIESTMGPLIRVYNKLYEKRPDDYKSVITDRLSFSTFCPLQTAINMGIITIVGNMEIPTALKDVPIFRWEGGAREENPELGIWEVVSWTFWDGEHTFPRVTKLNHEQLHYPIYSICTTIPLIEKIEENWTPETDKFTRGHL